MSDSNYTAKTGLVICVKKTKAVRINTSKTDIFTIRGESIEDVGSVVAKDGGAVRDVSQGIRKANGAFVQLYPVWKNRISARTKFRTFHSNVKSMLWKEMKTMTSRLQTFVNRCLRRILNIHWPEVISNEELWRRAEETEMFTQN